MDKDQLIVKNPAEIGYVVRQARKQVKLRQAETAGLCNVGIRFLSELENGKPTLQIGKVMRVLNALGLRILLKRREFGSD